MTNLLKQAQEKAIANILICCCKNRGNAEHCKECGKRTVKAQVREIIKQVYEDIVHEVEGMKYLITKSYGRKTIYSPFLTIGERKQYNQAIDDILNKLKSE